MQNILEENIHIIKIVCSAAIIYFSCNLIGTLLKLKDIITNKIFSPNNAIVKSVKEAKKEELSIEIKNKKIILLKMNKIRENIQQEATTNSYNFTPIINKFSIFTFNILCQKFMMRRDRKDLSLENRMQKVKDLIISFDPDIICLQETVIHTIKLFFENFLSSKYEVYYMHNYGSNFYNLTAFKKDKFELKEQKKINLDDIKVEGNRGIYCIELKIKNNNYPNNNNPILNSFAGKNNFPFNNDLKHTICKDLKSNSEKLNTNEKDIFDKAQNLFNEKNDINNKTLQISNQNYLNPKNLSEKDSPKKLNKPNLKLDEAETKNNIKPEDCNSDKVNELRDSNNLNNLNIINVNENESYYNTKAGKALRPKDKPQNFFYNYKNFIEYNKAENKNKLIIYNVHFPWKPVYDFEKCLILNKIADDIISKNQRNYIIIGDFNSKPNSLLMRMLYLENFINEIKYFKNIFNFKQNYFSKRNSEGDHSINANNSLPFIDFDSDSPKKPKTRYNFISTEKMDSFLENSSGTKKNNKRLNDQNIKELISDFDILKEIKELDKNAKQKINLAINNEEIKLEQNNNNNISAKDVGDNKVDKKNENFWTKLSEQKHIESELNKKIKEFDILKEVFSLSVRLEKEKHNFSFDADDKAGLKEILKLLNLSNNRKIFQEVYYNETINNQENQNKIQIDLLKKYYPSEYNNQPKIYNNYSAIRNLNSHSYNSYHTVDNSSLNYAGNFNYFGINTVYSNNEMVGYQSQTNHINNDHMNLQGTSDYNKVHLYNERSEKNKSSYCHNLLNGLNYDFYNLQDDQNLYQNPDVNGLSLGITIDNENYLKIKNMVENFKNLFIKYRFRSAYDNYQLQIKNNSEILNLLKFQDISKIENLNDLIKIKVQEKNKNKEENFEKNSPQIADKDKISQMNVNDNINNNHINEYFKNHPLYTNFTDNFKDTIDYIFHSKFLTVDKILKLPDYEELAFEDFLPSSKFPSDHLPLYAEFSTN